MWCEPRTLQRHGNELGRARVGFLLSLAVIEEGFEHLCFPEARRGLVEPSDVRYRFVINVATFANETRADA